MITLSPRLRYNLNRIWPFGLIWVVNGWMFLLIDTLATGNQNLFPETAITITPAVFLFATVTLLTVGCAVGVAELILLQKRFNAYPFYKKVLYKFFIYATFLLLVLFIVFPVSSALEWSLPINHPRVWNRVGNFFSSHIFLGVCVQLSYHLLISVLYAAISENLGHHTLAHFFTGKYHTPKEEIRIFMFLDMKASTSIAEQLGHIQYFDFLQAYYDTMSNPIIESHGEVYQYIGDEVVISWPMEERVKNARCIDCFFALKANLNKRKEWFEDCFGAAPDFKAGLHLGPTTIGEIGSLKREIVYSGDVLNATSRIQGLTKNYDTDILISNQLLAELDLPDKYLAHSMGEMTLRGKEERLTLFSIEPENVKN